MKRLTTLFSIAVALAGTAVLIGYAADWRFPLERHYNDNPAAIQYAIDHPQPYSPPTEGTPR